MKEPSLPEAFFKLPLKEAKRLFAKLYIEEILRDCNGHVTQAAERCGIDRRTIHRVMAEYDVDPKSFRKRKRWR